MMEIARKNPGITIAVFNNNSRETRLQIDYINNLYLGLGISKNLVTFKKKFLKQFPSRIHFISKVTEKNLRKSIGGLEINLAYNFTNNHTCDNIIRQRLKLGCWRPVVESPYKFPKGVNIL